MPETPSPEDRAPTTESESPEPSATVSEEDAVAEAAIAADAPGLDSTVDPKPDPAAPDTEETPTEAAPGPNAPPVTHGDPLAAEAIPTDMPQDAATEPPATTEAPA